MSRRLALLHGVNLDLLGERSPQHYGRLTLAQLEDRVRSAAEAEGWSCLCHQTNHEGEYVELIHSYRDADGLIVNPGAWTHYSWAIHDALELVHCPIVEVHLSAVEAREQWRLLSVVADLAAYRVSGKGPDGYLEAVRWLIRSAEPGGAERRGGS